MAAPAKHTVQQLSPNCRVRLLISQDKAKQKAKEKVIEDKTFGLKNKGKSAKVQKYVQQLQKSAQPQKNPRLEEPSRKVCAGIRQPEWRPRPSSAAAHCGRLRCQAPGWHELPCSLPACGRASQASWAILAFLLPSAGQEEGGGGAGQGAGLAVCHRHQAAKGASR